MDKATLLFALVTILMGLHGWLKGSVWFGFDGAEREITGSKAKLLSGLMIGAGIAVYISFGLALTLLVLSFVLPWYFDD